MARGEIVKRLISFFSRPWAPRISQSAARKSRHTSWRYAPCHILEEERIPNVIWFEDALAIYGGDTAVFELYLLVSDVSKAVAALRRSGYRDATCADSPINEPDRRGWTRLESPGGSSCSITVPIDASEWKYDLTHILRRDCRPLPPLNKFLDALMIQWLDNPKADYPE